MKTRPASAPVTFDLSEDLISRLERNRTQAGLRSLSAVVRAAIDLFDLAHCVPPAGEPMRQVSVRLSDEQRVLLKRAAKRTGASTGELLRLAIQAMPEPLLQPANGATVKRSPVSKSFGKSVVAKSPSAKSAPKKSAAAKLAAQKPAAGQRGRR